MRSTRDAFGDALLELGASDPRVVVLSADLASATKTRAFADAYPDRFIECGIAEANMIGIASGMSEHGFRVFMSSFGSFLTGRYDIIRVSLAYPRCPVVLVGTHSGLAIGRDGTTQMGLEDVNLMRGLPNMTVVQPATYTEAKAMTRLVADWIYGPVYMRLGRQPVADVPLGPDPIEIGRARVVRDGTDLTLAFTGCLADTALDVAYELGKAGLSCRVVNVHTLKPFDWSTVLSLAGKPVVTLEDHSVIGGLGSAVAEATTSSLSPVRVFRIGIEDVFAESGAPSDLYEKYGLVTYRILDRILEGLSYAEAKDEPIA